MKFRAIGLGVDQGKERAKIGEDIGANSDGGFDIGSNMVRREREQNSVGLVFRFEKGTVDAGDVLFKIFRPGPS